MTAALVPVAVPGTDRQIMATLVDGKPMVSLRHACDVCGLDPENQRRKLKGKSWATAVLITAVADDGKSREMTMIDRRTFTMWLATIDLNRVAPEARPILEAFQGFADRAGAGLHSWFIGDLTVFRNTLATVTDADRDPMVYEGDNHDGTKFHAYALKLMPPEFVVAQHNCKLPTPRAEVLF